MKVVIITNIPSPYRVDLFNFLADQSDLDITVLYSSANEDNRQWNYDQLTHKNIILKSKTLRIKKKLDFKYIHIPYNILSVLNEINPDIILGSEYNPTVYLAYKWSRLRNKKFISWSDGTLNSENDINIVQRIIRKEICSKSDALIASSTKTKEAQMFYGANKEKIFISYLTVDIDKYITERKNTDENNITFVGRLVKTKGLDLLINAIELINCEFKLNIIGDGPEYDNLIKLCKEKKIEDKVNFYGNKDREFIVDMYSKSKMLILPSRKECFGLVITEAMCAGIPIIASKYVDGAYDLIDEGINGFIVDPFEKKYVAQKIELLLKNKEMNKEMGINSKRNIDLFSINNVATHFIQAIKYVEL